MSQIPRLFPFRTLLARNITPLLLKLLSQRSQPVRIRQPCRFLSPVRSSQLHDVHISLAIGFWPSPLGWWASWLACWWVAGVVVFEVDILQRLLISSSAIVGLRLIASTTAIAGLRLLVSPSCVTSSTTTHPSRSWYMRQIPRHSMSRHLLPSLITPRLLILLPQHLQLLRAIIHCSGIVLSPYLTKVFHNLDISPIIVLWVTFGRRRHVRFFVGWVVVVWVRSFAAIATAPSASVAFCAATRGIVAGGWISCWIGRLWEVLVLLGSGCLVASIPDSKLLIRPQHSFN